MFKQYESGRSMVEILGMLAIAGILTTLSIIGYKYAIQLSRENGTLDVVNKTTSGAITGLMEAEFNEAMKDSSIDADLVISNVEVKTDGKTIETPMKTDIQVYRPNADELEFTLDNVTYGVCEKILSRSANYTSARLAKESKEWDFIYVDDSREKKLDFCKRVDALERRPMRPDPEVNPDANMILCYSKVDGGYNLPERTDNPCAEGIEDGNKVPDCGVCRNGVIVKDSDYRAPVYYRCELVTSLQNKLIDTSKTTVCGDKCCGSEGCNATGTDCAEISNSSSSSSSSSGGAAPCEVNGKIYADGEVINTCKQCSNGSVVARSEYTVPDCKICNDDGTLDDVGECCPGGTTTLYNNRKTNTTP